MALNWRPTFEPPTLSDLLQLIGGVGSEDYAIRRGL